MEISNIISRLKDHWYLIKDSELVKNAIAWINSNVLPAVFNAWESFKTFIDKCIEDYKNTHKLS